MDAKKYITQFKDADVLKRAFTHRSYLNENSTTTVSNERLEFLGDAVLELIISEHIFRTFTSFPEGKLTVIRSSIVRTESLASAAKELDLGSHLLLSRGEEENGGRDNASILANTYEAFLGALYIDKGWDTAKQFVHDTLVPMIETIMETESYRDAKSHLQEIVQERNKVTPTYKVIEEKGPDHAKIFTIGVYIGSKQIGTGTGSSKQAAESHAAQQALESLVV